MHKTKNYQLISKQSTRPTICISEKDYLKICGLLEAAKPTEIQWFQRVARDTAQDGTPCYRIFDVLVPFQEVSSATTETSEEDQTKTFNVLRENFQVDGKTNWKDFSTYIESLTCWSHSHVEMEATPSGQDVQQFKAFISKSTKEGSDQIWIMAIWNLKNEVFFLIDDPKFNYQIQNPVLKIEAQYSDMTDIVKERMRKKQYIPTIINKALVDDTKKAFQISLPSQYTPVLKKACESILQLQDDKVFSETMTNWLKAYTTPEVIHNMYNLLAFDLTNQESLMLAAKEALHDETAFTIKQVVETLITERYFINFWHLLATANFMNTESKPGSIVWGIRNYLETQSDTTSIIPAS